MDFNWFKFLISGISLIYLSAYAYYKYKNNFAINKESTSEESIENQNQELDTTKNHETEKVVIFQPTHYDQVASIAETIKCSKTCLIRLNQMDHKQKSKTVEFLFGICYSLNIEPEYIDEHTISIDPLHKTLPHHQREIKKAIIMNQNQKVKIFSPKQYDELQAIAENIIENKISIVKLHNLEEHFQTKVIQFLFGICYSYDISPEYIDNQTIIIDPTHKVR